MKWIITPKDNKDLEVALAYFEKWKQWVDKIREIWINEDNVEDYEQLQFLMNWICKNIDEILENYFKH